MPVGRPTNYSIEIASTLCERIATGEPLSHICREDDMPALSTVYKWLNAHKEFVEMYARCKEDQADTLADEILSIADEPPVPDGQTGKIDAAWVSWQKNRIDARKWTASKLKPKSYGDKVEQTVSGSLQIESVKRLIVDPTGN